MHSYRFVSGFGTQKILTTGILQIIRWNFKSLPFTCTSIVCWPHSPITRPDLTLYVISVGHEGDQLKIWKFYFICKKGHWMHFRSQFQCRNSLNHHFIWFIFEFSTLSCRPLLGTDPCQPTPMSAQSPSQSHSPTASELSLGLHLT